MEINNINSSLIDTSLFVPELCGTCVVCGEKFKVFYDEQICEKCSKAILWARKQMEGK